MKPIIEIKDVSKTFVVKERIGIFKSKKKIVEALKNVNLKIYEGEFFGLLGPNGAGKTTLIKCMTTLLIPTKGTIIVNGYDVLKDENMVRASLGCMLMGERGTYWKLTGRENLEYFGALHHVPPNIRKKRILELTHLLDMDDYIDRTVETYSSGQKMMISFARSVINDPPILFLDEPTITMDVHTARKIRKILKDMNKNGKTIIYTTHLMYEADELCDRIAIIDKGEIIDEGTPTELKSRISKDTVINIEGMIPHDIVEIINSINGIKTTAFKEIEENKKSRITIICKNSREILPKVIEIMNTKRAVIEYINPCEITLEDVFIAKTGRSLSADTKV